MRTRCEPVIRLRQESDIGACLAMARQVKERDGYPPLGRIDVEHFLAPAYELAAWVAESDTRIVGHAALHSTGFSVTIERAVEATGTAPERLGVVARMFVDPEVRGKGVARTLLDTVVEEAHARGLRPVLDTAAHFHAAIKLYEASGFVRAGDVTFVVPGEEPLDGLVFVGPPPGG
jgi:GNAT superfamily N-acetyltransferase